MAGVFLIATVGMSGWLVAGGEDGNEAASTEPSSTSTTFVDDSSEDDPARAIQSQLSRVGEEGLDAVVDRPMAEILDLGAALPDGAEVEMDPDSLIVDGDSAVALLTVTLPSGSDDEFVGLFRLVEDEWLLTATFLVEDPP